MRDLNGILFEGNLLRSIPHQANSSAPAFGKSFRDRVTEKLQAGVTDEYTNLLARMGALTQLTNKHGHRQCADGKFIRRACHAPCWKTPKHKARGLCRGEYHETGKEHTKETFITDDGDIITERNDGHVVSFSPASLLLFGCNNNTALISTGMQGSAVDYYMTDYGTKTELTTTQIFTILAESDIKVPDMSSLKGAKSRTVRYVNMLMRSIEQPLQFVATSLLNLPRELISHDSFSIYTSAFNRLITRETNDTKNTNFCQIKKNGETYTVSSFAQNYRFRAQDTSSEIGKMSIIRFAEETYVRKGGRLKLSCCHPLFLTHGIFFFKTPKKKISHWSTFHLQKTRPKYPRKIRTKCFALFLSLGGIAQQLKRQQKLVHHTK